MVHFILTCQSFWRPFDAFDAFDFRCQKIPMTQFLFQIFYLFYQFTTKLCNSVSLLTKFVLNQSKVEPNKNTLWKPYHHNYRNAFYQVQSSLRHTGTKLWSEAKLNIGLDIQELSYDHTTALWENTLLPDRINKFVSYLFDAYLIFTCISMKLITSFSCWFACCWFWIFGSFN